MRTLFKTLETGECSLRPGSEAEKTLSWATARFKGEPFTVAQFTAAYQAEFPANLGPEFPRPANPPTLRRRVYYLWESGHLAKSDGWDPVWTVNNSWKVGIPKSEPSGQAKELSLSEIERLFGAGGDGGLETPSGLGPADAGLSDDPGEG